jgi:GTP cyclohydrolase I
VFKEELKMVDDRNFLVDVGIQDLPFPIRVMSKVNPKGQHTVANISIRARIMDEFEARWIDRFIQLVHYQREQIGTQTLKADINGYLNKLNAESVIIDLKYPYFVEKSTPVSKEKCLVRYSCIYSAKAVSANSESKIYFRMEIPCITTYPGSDPDKPGGLFGQLSHVIVEIETLKEIYAEDLVEFVDNHALSPIYSFLSKKDQSFIIQRVHSEKKTSVKMVDGIKKELAHHPGIDWYSVRCANFGMLHNYSTAIMTEKSFWVPFNGYEQEI